MPSGNGNRAKQKRERNQKKKEQDSGNKSQLKSNEAAKTIICKVCRQSFMCTTKEAELRMHQENKHEKQEFAACFPEYATVEEADGGDDVGE